MREKRSDNIDTTRHNSKMALVYHLGLVLSGKGSVMLRKWQGWWWDSLSSYLLCDLKQWDNLKKN